MKLNSLFVYCSTVFILFLMILLSACIKNTDNSTADMCTKVKQVKIKSAKTTYYVGETINLSTVTTPDGYYTWYFGQYSGIISSSTGYSVSDCAKGDGGWYYVVVNNVDCTTPGRDSIYITVVNNPDSAPCNPTNNAVTFTMNPDITFTPKWSIDANWGVKLMYGNQGGGYPDYGIYFHSYWNNHEPEDGAYTISSLTDLISGNSNVYQVATTSLYQSINFYGNSGKVYVTHAGGKMRVTFCSIPMSGTWGSSVLKTVSTGRMTAP